ncbi:hypothetical protein D3C76_1354550 [compost metagenome]
MPWHLGDSMSDVVHHIDSGHALLLEQKDGLALLFTENRHQHVGASDFTLARALYVKDSTLQDTLETQGWLGFAILVVEGDQWRGGVDELLQVVLEFVEVGAACTQHGGGCLVIQ